MALSDVCTGTFTYTSDADLSAFYASGLITATNEPTLTAAISPTTGLISPTILFMNIQLPRRPAVYDEQGGIQKDNIKELIDTDRLTADKIQKEYCYYLQRYNFVLNEFLTLAVKSSPTETDKTDAQTKLNTAKTLNRRLNILINILNAVGTSRVEDVNKNVQYINTANQQITEKLKGLSDTYSVINNDKTLMNTRSEMIRYTIEKNNHMVNQISMWAGLNILALGTIFWIYRNL